MGCIFSKTENDESSPTTPQEDPDMFVEGVVCNDNDLNDNEMKTFKLGEGEILLVKQNGKVTALGTQCTHYGAPLEKAVLGKGRIRCQWHGACFNIANGDIEDHPGLDSLPCHKVTIRQGEILVKANKASLLTNKREPKFAIQCLKNPKTFVVVGGGAAGVVCVEQLRKDGFTGYIVFILGENFLPYDRVALSKVYKIKYKDIILRSEEFYKERQIDIIKGAKLLKLDPINKKLKLSNKVSVPYDKVLLATGTRARRMQCEGYNLKNIFTLRNIKDARIMYDAVNSQSKVLIVGSSFIAMEIASTLVGNCATITVLSVDSMPFIGSLGPEVGATVQALFEEKNVKFFNSTTVEKFLGDGKVSSVVIKGPVSTTIAADVVIFGIGIIPNTEYLNGLDIELKPKKTIPVNKYLETSLSNVYAAGDIAHAPILNWTAAIGHWGIAQYHGKLAAHNMMGQKKKIESVPFFWTVFFGKSFRYCGFAPKYKKVTIKGDLKNLSFVAFYSFDDDKVHAVLTIQRDPIAAAFSEELRHGYKLHIDDVDSWLSKFNLEK